ncbi:hypothetical protein OO013_19185 [Mangrovivirga sp. M17]|uniref:DUF1049 domain-containing protein n=1 Tax=Mangrovivirga halotolerans TaxID=2993936 RepID=A0ABT3RW55_9BACT|nr:hypothetical protein [Mangrovivirga halotolerans]MCX2746014.1 hypothetical protein [Mangrovivirga halotolerans]
MKKFTIGFFIVYLLFHIAVIIAATIATGDSFLNLLKYDYLFKPGAYLGLVLFLVNIVLFLKFWQDQHKKISKLDKEKTELKAKMFDLAEESKQVKSQGNSDSDTKNQ